MEGSPSGKATEDGTAYIQKTKQIYLHQPHLHSYTTHILEAIPWSDVPEEERSLFKSVSGADIVSSSSPPSCPSSFSLPAAVITTVETVFYAQGGGQPSDTGVIKSGKQEGKKKGSASEESESASVSVSAAASPSEIEFHVQNVRRHPFTGRILHFGRYSFPYQGGGGGRRDDTAFSYSTITPVLFFKPDEIVIQQIDSAKRDLHSRIHTAGHVLGLAVRHLMDSGVIPGDLVDGKAQHYPDAASVEFLGLIPSEHKAEIQMASDELVERDLPVEVVWWTEEEMKDKCVAVLDVPEYGKGELMRAVNIVGAGAYPCGGTHVLSTKQIGKLNVRSIKRKTGITKISYSVD